MKSLKLLMSFLLFSGFLFIGGSMCHADEYTVQDSSFTLYNAARINDGTASDGYSIRIVNDVANWNVQYNNWDFSYLKCGVLYDVYARIKVDHAVTNPTGNAFMMGIYDVTYPGFLSGTESKQILASNTQDMVWKEFRLGTFKPNSGVNNLCLYVGGIANASQVSDIYVDSIIFKEHNHYTIEDISFSLTGGAAIISDPLSHHGADAARMTNGPGGDFNIEVPIDGTKIEAGKQYDICWRAMPELSSWDTSSGIMYSYSVYDYTTSSYIVNPTAVTYNKIFQFYFSNNTGSIAIDPSHDVRVRFHKVDNASNFPAFKVDYVWLQESPADEKQSQPISTYPYKISPANADGLNDTSDITYTLSSQQAIYVRVYSYPAGTLVRTLVNGVSQSGTNTVTWNGKNDGGSVVANGLYTIIINNGTSDIMRTNIQVIAGVTLSPRINTGLDLFPRGVYFSATEIPFNSVDAQSWLETHFTDIQNLGANLVWLTTTEFKPADVYSDIYDKAAAHNLKVINFPDASLLNSTLNNDEVALRDKLSMLITPYSSKSALYGYMLADEPPKDPIFRDGLYDQKRILETIDPGHPSFFHIQGLTEYPYFHDVVKTRSITADPYFIKEGFPIGDFRHNGPPYNYHYEQWLDYGTYTVRKDITDRAPLWTTLQTFNHVDGGYRDPTPEEVRAYTYLALGHGSKGISYFSYTTMSDWTGLVDYNYNHATDWTTCQALFSEINTMAGTISNMRRIANAAATSGGGNSFYPSADVTTHEDITTDNKYLIAVNHDCVNSANVAITIDRAKLGMNITEIRNVHDNSLISFSTTSSSYTISNLSFNAGAGKILKLVKEIQPAYTGQDSLFSVYNGATKGNTDISTSDSGTAMQEVSSTTSWNFQWFWDKTNLMPGGIYDLYAVVKVKYNDSYEFTGNPSGDFAFAYGAYDSTASTAIVPTTYIPITGVENMLWHTVKIGTFIPSQTNTQFCYIMPSSDPGSTSTVYVDKFYFVRSGM